MRPFLRGFFILKRKDKICVNNERYYSVAKDIVLIYNIMVKDSCWRELPLVRGSLIKLKGADDMDEKNLVRVNSRLGYTQNEWLDNESKRTGLSKSGLIQMAVEQYIAQKQALNAMSDMSVMFEKLEKIESEMKKQ